jgi:membrane protease YdiL (CAAX protease family)
MEIREVFLNEAGRLRSGFRLTIFFAAYFALSILFEGSRPAFHAVVQQANPGLAPHIDQLVFRIGLLLAAVLTGWACNYWFEGLPWRALGLTSHQHWSRDFVVGSAVGSVSLLVAALIVIAGKGVHLSTGAQFAWLPFVRALTGATVIFFFAALAEEAGFRGYPLQTLTRAKLVSLGIVLTSVPFALLHWQNPGATIVSTANTALAGVWLAVAYLRTRSLWFPLGIHWSWNLVQGPVLGLAVSGQNFSSHTLLRATDLGPAWLTGGRYGIEGGVACTIALLLSTGFILWTRLVSATPELKQMTSEENPVRCTPIESAPEPNATN